MPRFCSSCGAEMVDNAAFCPKCGKATGVQSGYAGAAIPPASSTASTAGVQDNLGGLLAYLFLPAIVFLVMAPYNKNRFLRFHSFQAIFLWVLMVVVNAVLAGIPVLNLFLLPLIGLAEVVVGLICMIKAFQGEFFKLPFLGEFAEKRAEV